MNIRVDLNYPIQDGTEAVFRSPVDCSQITGLKVYYPENGTHASKEFALADAHGNNVGDIDHLFAENVVVKVILDVTTGMAFVQNADTNAYIEKTFIKSVNGTTPDENGNVQNTLIVTIDENDKPSHTSEQIYDWVQSGGTVLLHVSDAYWGLQYASPSFVSFFHYDDDDWFYQYDIWEDTGYYYEKENVTREIFDDLAEKLPVSYMVKAVASYDEETDVTSYTVENFNWDELQSAVEASKAVFCRVWHPTSPEDDFTITDDYQLVEFSEEENLARFSMSKENGGAEYLTVYNDGTVFSSVYKPTGITKTLLWQNASPFSSFAAQNIVCPLNKYDEVEIEFVAHQTTGIDNTTKMPTLIRQTVSINNGRGPKVKGRVFGLAGSKIDALMERSFDIVYASPGFIAGAISFKSATAVYSSSGGNSYMVPYKIYGIKGVQ